MILESGKWDLLKWNVSGLLNSECGRKAENRSSAITGTDGTARQAIDNRQPISFSRKAVKWFGRWQEIGEGKSLIFVKKEHLIPSIVPVPKIIILLAEEGYSWVKFALESFYPLFYSHKTSNVNTNKNIFIFQLNFYDALSGRQSTEHWKNPLI